MPLISNGNFLILSHCVIATVEPFKNKIVDHTSADQGMANNYQLKFDE